MGANQSHLQGFKSTTPQLGFTRQGRPCVRVVRFPEIYAYQARGAHHPGGARLLATISWQRWAWDGLWMIGRHKGGEKEDSVKEEANKQMEFD